MTMIANEARREDGKIADIGAYINEDVVGVDAELRACPGGCEAFRRRVEEPRAAAQL